jgi:uncharacterized protein
MGIERMRRRHWMVWAIGAMCARPAGAVGGGLHIAAAWRHADVHQAGVLRREGGRLVAEATLDLPSRPHAVRVDAEGTLIVVGRRPGDWLLRWAPGQASPVWQWTEADRSFNGHVLPSRDGRRLFTTETDLASGESLVGVRDARSLEKVAEWPTGGSDAHDLLQDDDGALFVANGGVTAQPETGRLKRHLESMASSIVRLDTTAGRTLGRWQLPDRRLSLRHLAWGPRDGRGHRVLGVALQSEHADPILRAAAPVLAVFDGHSLRACDAPVGLAGYGGDLVGTAEGFAVSCPRADAVALWHADGRWITRHMQPRACALLKVDGAGTPTQVWAGGVAAVARGCAKEVSLALPGDPAIRLDNHWALLSPRSAPLDVIERKETS